MAVETISIQSIWSPPGKDFPKVITTPEQAKFHLYKDQEQLTQNLKVGSLVTIDCFDTTNRQGKPIRRIQNIIVDGQPIISQAVAEIKPQESTRGLGTPRTYGRDEDRVDQRTFVMETGQDLRAGIIEPKHPRVISRETILASWVNLEVEKGSNAPVPQVTEVPKLTINMDWLSESIKKIWGTYKAFVQFLGERYSVAMDGSVKDVLDRLSVKQQADLTKEIQERLNE